MLVEFNGKKLDLARGKRHCIDGKAYRIRRGKLVEIPAEWVGETVHPQTLRKRKKARQARKKAKISSNPSAEGYYRKVKKIDPPPEIEQYVPAEYAPRAQAVNHDGTWKCSRCGMAAYYDGRCGDGPILMCTCNAAEDAFWANERR